MVIAKLQMIKFLLAGFSALGMIGGLMWIVHDRGVRSCERAHQAAVDTVRQEQRRLADRLEEAQRENRQQRERQSRIIYMDPDPTGCADAPALDSVLDSLRGGG